jgi:ubiquinone/menaquinone biosynthesis C-methylase UbiE
VSRFTCARSLTRTIAAGVLAVAATSQPERDTADAAKLIEVLEIRAGSIVADVGAGSGPLVPMMSRQVGPAGRVYATDVSRERIPEITKLVADKSLANVTVVLGAAAQTNLPDGCCDAIFMRLVYHHFGDPPAMNASLLRSLKPGGRLAVLEFAPDSRVSAPPGKRNEGKSHGVMAATIVEESKAAGFVDIQEIPWTAPTIAAIARKPAGRQESGPADDVIRRAGRQPE